MRSAEEIYQDATLKSLGNNPTGTRYDIIITAMNMGRKEAIEAAWEMAILGNGQSILSLIKELK